MKCFDPQVNGYAGVDFNGDDLREEDLSRACRRLREDGMHEILATVITDTEEAMCSRLRRLVTLRDSNVEVRSVIIGLHIEGPFLSPVDGFRGAHPADSIRQADAGLMDRLLEAAGGHTLLVTLAPEQDPDCRLIRRLVDSGIKVAAGHTDASRDQLAAATDAGLTLFTHLGNGCPPSLPRHDNIIQRALSLRDRLRFSFIADGIHIPFFALGNYLALVGYDRAIVTTDAMAAAGLGPGVHRLGRWKVRVGEDLAARSPDGTHLVGSALGMPGVHQRLQRELGVTTDQLYALTRVNPKSALGLSQ